MFKNLGLKSLSHPRTCMRVSGVVGEKGTRAAKFVLMEEATQHAATDEGDDFEGG